MRVVLLGIALAAVFGCGVGGSAPIAEVKAKVEGSALRTPGAGVAAVELRDGGAQ